MKKKILKPIAFMLAFTLSVNSVVFANEIDAPETNDTIEIVDEVKSIEQAEIFDSTEIVYETESTESVEPVDSTESIELVEPGENSKSTTKFSRSLNTSLDMAKTYFLLEKNNVLTDADDTFAILSATGDLSSYTLPDVSTFTPGTYSPVSDLSKRILLLEALNKDPRTTYENQNLIENLLKAQGSNGKFGNYINSHFFSILALNSANEDFDKEKAVQAINDYYVGNVDDYGLPKEANSFGDTDTAGFALICLSTLKDVSNANTLIDETISYLKGKQLPDGGFASNWTPNVSNPNSTGTVISGLVSVNEDIYTWTTPNGKTPIDSLLSFQSNDGGFFYDSAYPINDEYSFNQAVMSLGDIQNGYSIYTNINQSDIIADAKKDLLNQITIAQSKNQSDYTTDSFNNLTNVLNQSILIYNDENATNEEILQSTNNLKSAINALVSDSSNPQNKINVSQSINTNSGTTISTKTNYTVKTGTTVFELLKNSLNEQNIPFSYRGSGTSIYISKIGDYEEFQYGVNSGFEYYVNGVKLSNSSATVALNDGDYIKWVYTDDYKKNSSSNDDLIPNLEVIPELISSDDISNSFGYDSITDNSLSNGFTQINTINKNIYDAYKKSDELSNFEQIFMKKYSNINDPNIIDSIKDEVVSSKGDYRKPTDLSRIALSLQIYDENISDVNGINLLEKLNNYENLGKQGVNGYIYALHVYTNENNTDYQNKMIENILLYQNADGGFSLDLNDTSDLDITAMALDSLAPYKDDENVYEAISKGLLYIENNIEGAGLSSETLSQIIIALSSLNISFDDEAFIYNDENLITRLLEFKISDTTFSHYKDDVADNISTEQAVLALQAVYNAYNNEAPIFSNHTYTIQIDDDTIKDSSINITRYEFIKLLLESFNEDVVNTNEQNFVDVDSKNEFFPFVETAFKMKLINGIETDSGLVFNGDAYITKEDLSVILNRYKKFYPIYRNLTIADINSVSEYAIDSVTNIAGTGLMLDSKNYFHPKQYISISDATKLVNFLVEESR